MGEVISLWPLTGIAVIVVGFLLRFNPVLVVIIAGDRHGTGGAYADRHHPREAG